MPWGRSWWKRTARLGQGQGHLPVPVGERHHDVERSQAEAEVEEGVVVGDPILLVVHGPSCPVLLHRGHVGRQTLAVFRLHQPVHLGVVGRADTWGGGIRETTGRILTPGL